MDESKKSSDFGIRELSLIDVTFEDDCLISSPFASPPHHAFSENQEHKSVRFLEPFDAINVETSFNSPGEREQGSQPRESSEPEKTRSGKYNLRKSLAWDNAFFTSEGFLEPEELSSMIGGTEKSEKHALPGIQEDVLRSTESLSTLDSDSLTLKGLESDLFADIRASIQKSSNISNVANSNIQKKLGLEESQTIQYSKKVDPASQDKMKPKAALKKPSVGTQGSGKATKQVSVRSQNLKSVASNGQSTISPCKPPKVQGKINLISTVSTKRASLGANRIKMEKDSSKNASGRGAPALKMPSSGGTRNLLPRPTPPSRSLRSSAATKIELTTSCSSFDSSVSGSSDSTGKTSTNSVRRKNISGTQNRSSLCSTVKSTSRTASRSKSQPGSSHLTSYLRSVTKLSPSVSPSSSISEWSSESTSSTATANRRPMSTRTSLDSSSSMGVSVNSDAPQVLDSHNNSSDQPSVGNNPKVPCLQGEYVKGTSTRTGSLCAVSSKPSGLRMPSPKIGFFDGARSGGRTPNGSVQSHSGVPSALTRVGAGSINPSSGSNKAKLGKVQSAKTALANQSTQQTTLTVKPRPSLPLQASANAAIKVSSVSRNVKSPLISPKLRSRMSPKTSVESLSKGAESGFKVYDISTLESPDVLKNKTSPESKGTTDALCMKLNPMGESTHAFGDSHSICDAENINPSEKVIENAKLGQHFPNNVNEKERAHIEDKVKDLTKQVAVIDINVEVEKTVTSLTPESILTKGS